MTQVNLSNETQFILENFALINSSIVFKKGNVIKTIANAENILAENMFVRNISLRTLQSMI